MKLLGVPGKGALIWWRYNTFSPKTYPRCYLVDVFHNLQIEHWPRGATSGASSNSAAMTKFTGECCWTHQGHYPTWKIVTPPPERMVRPAPDNNLWTLALISLIDFLPKAAFTSSGADSFTPTICHIAMKYTGQGSDRLSMLCTTHATKRITTKLTQDWLEMHGTTSNGIIKRSIPFTPKQAYQTYSNISYMPACIPNGNQTWKGCTKTLTQRKEKQRNQNP